ncbi:MAG: M20/M25/M40 family metallo-hydrolase [Desulfosoma sp.]
MLNHCKRIGLEVQLHDTAGHPVITAFRCHHPSRPTLLIYGHYDVQPAEPEEDWNALPFQPTVRDGFIYARGASDDKGQFFTYLKALEVVLAARGDLPINVKLLVEGEEEIGSPHLGAFLNKHREQLKADAIAISDGSQFSDTVPAITYGLRGLAYLELSVQGPRTDLHSGSFGGIALNPIHALVNLLDRLKNPDGTIAIPGFYDAVAPLEP